MFNYHMTAHISHVSKVILKFLQGLLQQYMNGEIPDVQAGFRKGGGISNQIATIRWITEISSRKLEIPREHFMQRQAQ